MSKPDRRVRIKRDYKTQYPEPLTVKSGETVRVGREDSTFPGWKWCEARDGRKGWVPVELLSNDGAQAKLRQDYSARELAVVAGEVVTVEDARHAWLLVRNQQGDSGWIPDSHAEVIQK
jgi:uncharacterized protein YgiM (DUF1202 family)